MTKPLPPAPPAPQGGAAEPSCLTPSSPGCTLKVSARAAYLQELTPGMLLLSIHRDDAAIVGVSSRGENWKMMTQWDESGSGMHGAFGECPGGVHSRERGPWSFPEGLVLGKT